MSGIVDALYQVKYNPFKYGEHIASFYSAVNGVDGNLLLVPLIIPLCSHPVYAQKIARANKKSSIWSIFKDRVQLYDLQERVDEFKGLAEQSMQYCLVNDWLSVESESLTVQYMEDTDAALTLQKTAVSLGKLFSGHSVVEIYAFLGVKP